MTASDYVVVVLQIADHTVQYNNDDKSINLSESMSLNGLIDRFEINDENTCASETSVQDSQESEIEPNDLHHEGKQYCNSTEERLKLNILRLLMNLKRNNATETCIDTCSRDLVGVLEEYKEVQVNSLSVSLYLMGILITDKHVFPQHSEGNRN